MAYAPPDPPVVPYLMVRNGARALDWYVRAFGGRQVERHDTNDGRLGHAMIELANGGAIYLSDEFPELIDRVGTLAPDTGPRRRARWRSARRPTNSTAATPSCATRSATSGR